MELNKLFTIRSYFERYGIFSLRTLIKIKIKKKKRNSIPHMLEGNPIIGENKKETSYELIKAF